MTLVGTVIFSLADKAADDDVTGAISLFRLHPFTDEKVRTTISHAPHSPSVSLCLSLSVCLSVSVSLSLTNSRKETVMTFHFMIFFTMQIDGRGKFSMSTLGKEIILKENLDHDAMRLLKQSQYFLNISVQVRIMIEVFWFLYFNFFYW